MCFCINLFITIYSLFKLASTYSIRETMRKIKQRSSIIILVYTFFLSALSRCTFSIFWLAAASASRLGEEAALLEGPALFLSSESNCCCCNLTVATAFSISSVSRSTLNLHFFTVSSCSLLLFWPSSNPLPDAAHTIYTKQKAFEIIGKHVLVLPAANEWCVCVLCIVYHVYLKINANGGVNLSLLLSLLR